MNFMVYGALVSASVIFALIRACVFLLMSLQCSQRLHDKMIVAVLKAPVLFFDLNPIGRVLNRFSKDIGCVDELLPKTFLEAIQQSLFFLAAAIVPVIANPWLTLVLGPLTMACVYIVRYYLKTARELKRIESITRSPVFSHISETLNGLDTIRTRGKQKDFINQLYRYNRRVFLLTETEVAMTTAISSLNTKFSSLKKILVFHRCLYDKGYYIISKVV